MRGKFSAVLNARSAFQMFTVLTKFQALTIRGIAIIPRQRVVLPWSGLNWPPDDMTELFRARHLHWFPLRLIFLLAAGIENLQAIVSFAALLAFVLFFGLGSGPIPWIYLPEVLPNEIKGRGASLGTSINWVATFLVGLSFPIMLRALKVGGSYLVYAVLNVLAFVFCWFYMVETKQQSLAHIQKLLLLDI